MSGGLIAGSILQGLGGLASGVFNYYGQKQANQANIQLAREGQAYETQMWERQQAENQRIWEQQNEYNSPLNQMNRLKSAGLNPNLVYGSGNVTATSSSQQQTPSQPRAIIPRVENELSNITTNLNVLGMYQNLQQSQANIARTKAETDLINQRKLNELENNLYFKWRGLGQKQTVNFGSDTYLDRQNMIAHKANMLGYQDRVQQQLFESGELLNRFKFDNLIKNYIAQDKKLNLDLNQGLMPYGLTSRDNALARLTAVNILPTLVKRFPNLFKNMKYGF